MLVITFCQLWEMKLVSMKRAIREIDEDGDKIEVLISNWFMVFTDSQLWCWFNNLIFNKIYFLSQ
jgi:hypothetical protein